jgi:hypothetical protein
VKPICKVCKSIGRSCTYDRPERKRGPSQGVRQRLEGQVESLESILGYMADAYPHICSDVIRNLRLDDAEIAMLNSLPQNSSMNTPSPTSSLVQSSVHIYPHYSKQEARTRWRRSSFAKALAPSLGLTLAAEVEDEEMFDSVRYRIEEARRARMRMTGGMSSNSSTTQTSATQHHLHHHLQRGAAPPPLTSTPFAPPASSSSSSYQPHYPHTPMPHYQYPSHHSTKERSYPAQPTMPSNPSHIPSFPPDQPNAHSFPYHQQQPPYSRPPDSFPTAASIVPHMEPYGSYSNTTFDGETDALAYALGLTYSSSPQNKQMMNQRHSSHSSSWMGPPSSIPESPSDMMQSIDQHMRSSGAADDIEEQQRHLDFFADHDLQPDHQQLSVLHQLGLQGSIDMPTPIDHSDRSNIASSSILDDNSTPNSASANHHRNTTNHWLQPIRGIN